MGGNSNTTYSEKIIMSIGGSLIVPQGGIDTTFLSHLNTFIRTQLAKHQQRQFFLVVGGGTTARHYRDAGREVLHHELTDEDLDWIGIHATRLNAQLIRTIFRDVAHPNLIKHYEIIRRVSEPVVVAAGWKPGFSTDYDAVLLCEDYGSKTVLNLSNITKVYDKDPKVYADAKPMDELSWTEYRKLVGDVWSPGLNSPFDPVAAKKAQEMKVRVYVLNGNDFGNIEKCVEGKKFTGTIIQ